MNWKRRALLCRSKLRGSRSSSDCCRWRWQPRIWRSNAATRARWGNRWCGHGGRRFSVSCSAGCYTCSRGRRLPFLSAWTRIISATPSSTHRLRSNRGKRFRSGKSKASHPHSTWRCWSRTCGACSSEEHEIRLPVYDRGLHDPVPGMLCASPHHRIVVLEGLHLLRPEQSWKEALACLDFCMLLELPLETCRRRVVTRKIAGGRLPADVHAHFEARGPPDARGTA